MELEAKAIETVAGYEIIDETGSLIGDDLTDFYHYPEEAKIAARMLGREFPERKFEVRKTTRLRG